MSKDTTDCKECRAWKYKYTVANERFKTTLTLAACIIAVENVWLLCNWLVTTYGK